MCRQRDAADIECRQRDAADIECRQRDVTDIECYKAVYQQLYKDEVDLMVYVMKIEKAPLDSYADIGGLEAQSHEIKEAVELPLTHPQLYAHIGIKLSKGVIFYGERGTGKTVLAKRKPHQMTEPWKLEDYQPPCHLQMELQNRDIFSGFPTTRTLTLGGLKIFHQSEELIPHLGTLHKDMFLYQLLSAKGQAILEFHCNTIESLG
ncbi:hypothetical protein Bca4012_077282 [Brassica carinata]